MEPQDVGSPVSPPMTMVKSPASHYGGGTLFTVSPQAPSPLVPGMYYPQHSPVCPESVGVGMVPSPGAPDPRVSSPAQQCYLSPGAQSPYSQDAGMGGHPVPMYTPSVSSPPQNTLPAHLLDLDTRKYIEQNPIDLDFPSINSAELRSLLPSSTFNASMVDAHLSENLSSNLNLIDHPPHTNKLNSKSGVTVGGAASSIPFMQNIPTEPKDEIGSTGSDSFNNIKTQIEELNKYSNFK